MGFKAMIAGAARRAGSNGRCSNARLFSASVLLAASLAAAEEGKLDFSGFAWTQYQNGLTPMYKGAANYDYNGYMSVGGMLFLGSRPSEHWSTNLSLGVAYGNSAIRGSIRNDSTKSFISKTNPNTISLDMGGFLYEANFGYQSEKFGLKVGKFHYSYSDLNHNMGLYLLRGPVYPGFLYSGFDQIGALTKTGVLSSWTPSEALRWDVLGAFETDFKPYMDINLSSFLTFKAGPLELGTGVETQRLVEFNSCITTPKNPDDVNECLGGQPPPVFVGPGNDLYRNAFFVIDTAGVGAGGAADTTTYSLAGTKVMLRGAVDIKRIMSSYNGSRKDLVFYMEAALLGVKNYKHIYENRAERIPVLFGLNLPTFGMLDLLSLEVEYYNAPYQNDPYKLVGAYDVFGFSEGNNNLYAMSPIPPSNKAGFEHLAKAQEDFDPKQDNWKWSVFASKRFYQRITFLAQVASDHWRVPNNDLVKYEAMANPAQFYGSLKVAYSL